MITAMATATVEESAGLMTVDELLASHRLRCNYCGTRKAWVAWVKTYVVRVEGFGDCPVTAVAALLRKIGGGNG